MSEPRTVVSYSEIDTYRQCRLKHQLSYHENWRTEDESEALVRGTAWHSIMEEHYKLVGEPDVDAAALYAHIGPLLYDRETGRQSTMEELLEWMYRGYVDQYQLDSDWEIVGIEVPFQAPLPDRDGNESNIHLKGTVDLIVKDHSAGGGLWIVDHKTCKNLPKQKDFDMEDQTAIYTYLLMEHGWDIRGAWYNHVRTWKLQREMTPEERFKRTPTVRGKRELFHMAVEAYETMEEAYDRLDRFDGKVVDAPRTPDGERCGWKCGYTEACLAGRKIGPERTRGFLAEVGFTRHETKPGPTFNKGDTSA